MTPTPPDSALVWLQQQPGFKTRRTKLIGSGSGHRIWRVMQGRADWIVRERETVAHGYVADYHREHAIWKLAEQAGIAPRLLACLDQGRVWISEFIAPSEQRITAQELGHLHHHIGQLTPVPWVLDLHQQLAHYQGRAKGTERDTLGDVTRPILDAIASLKDGPVVLCHNDLLPANVLGSRGERRVIDWEYAAMGSPYFDAAATLAALPAEQEQDYLMAAFPSGHDASQLAAGQTVYRAMHNAWLRAQRTSA
jgi:thiamine kinase